MTKCSNCLTEDTPMWRRCVDTDMESFITLCNACGLYYKAKGHHRPRLLITKKSQITKYEHLMNCLATEADETDKKMVQFNDEELSDVRIISCVNCKCINTSLWRKDHKGNSMCNACGLYYKKNGFHRPIKEDERDVFIEIDSNVIRFNKIKRRKRSMSKEYEKSSPISNKKKLKKKKNLELTNLNYNSGGDSMSETSDHRSPTSPLINKGSTASTPPDYNYTLYPSVLPPSTLLLPQDSDFSMAIPVINAAPRLPPISSLLHAIDNHQQQQFTSQFFTKF